MGWTDDPVRDAHRYQDECDAWESKLPRCSECGKRIQDEELYYIDGKIYCENCIWEKRRYSCDFMED